MTSDPTSLEQLFRPRSIAIIGASPKPGNPRNSVVRAAVKHGFAGKIYPVTPTHAEIEGFAAYPSVADLPEVPDVALIITPAATVPGLIDDCGARGIRNAVVFSAGFEETEGGKALAEELAAAARRHGMNVIGPNCQGIWAVQDKTMLTYSPAAMNWDEIHHGPIAIISQSGALAGAICNSLQRNKLGISYMVSVGNETVFDCLDALEFVVEQGDVRVVALYIEGLNDAGRIFAIAEKARANGVQIVMLKAGQSEIGQSATASHTGKIASPHAIYADLLDQAGVLPVDSLAELLTAVEVLGFMGEPRRGIGAEVGIAALSSSGGAGALLADHSANAGLGMAQFGAETQARLDELLPDFARKANPIDLTGQINTNRDLIIQASAAVAADPATEAVIVQHGSNGRYWLERDGEVFIELAKTLPVVISFVGETFDPDLRRRYLEAGVLLGFDPSTTMQALSLLYRRRRMRGTQAAPGADRTARPVPAGWAAAMDYCAEAGVTPTPWRTLSPGETAASACDGLHFPVVVKALPEDAAHKTELGLVTLRVETPEAVDALAERYRGILKNPAAGILVQEMERGGVEVVLSCMRGTDFGPVLTVGGGGVGVELYRDVTHLALPLTPAQAESALRRLKLWEQLQGFRGAPRADIEALVAAIVAFGDRFLHSPDLQEVELNPVLVREGGQGLRVVDALFVTAAAAGGDTPTETTRQPEGAMQA